jgi:hypothetical protein
MQVRRAEDLRRRLCNNAQRQAVIPSIEISIYESLVQYNTAQERLSLDPVAQSPTELNGSTIR